MNRPQVTIIGLGFIGGSIGLGLKASAKAIHVVGHDGDHGVGRLAKKKGAVDDSIVNLISACEDADLVIIATPITAIREILELIGPHLKRGCVVTDTANLKQPVLAWAAETLPEGVSFVGGDPLLRPEPAPTGLAPRQGLDQARSDLFENGLYALCPSVETSPAAVKRVTDMVNLLKARAFFVDPVEHDGMRAMVEGLPLLISLALMQLASNSPGWQEARKLADHGFSTATAPLANDAAVNHAQVQHNADHLLPRIDALIHALTRLRERVEDESDAALADAFDQAATARNRWLTDWSEGKWEEELTELGIKGTLGSLGDMLGFGLGSGKRREE
jgi:prephenate dehydrogenase